MVLYAFCRLCPHFRLCLRRRRFLFTMYVDLNVPIPSVSTPQKSQPSKKGKGKQTAQSATGVSPLFTPGQLTELEARIDLLVHCSCDVVLVLHFVDLVR